MRAAAVAWSPSATSSRARATRTLTPSPATIFPQPPSHRSYDQALVLAERSASAPLPTRRHTVTCRSDGATPLSQPPAAGHATGNTASQKSRAHDTHPAPTGHHEGPPTRSLSSHPASTNAAASSRSYPLLRGSERPSSQASQPRQTVNHPPGSASYVVLEASFGWVFGMFAGNEGRGTGSLRVEGY